MSWNKFKVEREPRSIALDGYVCTGPRFARSGPWANFNHHEEVARLETRATCAQVLMAVRQGLFGAFQDEYQNPDATIHVNDCDEDVSLAVFILRNSHLVTNAMNPLLNKLVFMEDMLDTTAGAYPFPRELETLKQVMWVFAPYHNFRVNGGLDRRNVSQFEGVISDVGRRVMAYVTGGAEAPELDTRYEEISKHHVHSTRWSVIREVGPNARVAVYGDGIQAFVSVRERDDGRWTYTLGRSSQFIPFPIPSILKRLNQDEGSTDGDVWGGSDIIAGSPRINGSQIPPDQVNTTIEEVLSE